MKISRLFSLFSVILTMAFFLTGTPRTLHAEEGLTETQREEVKTLLQEYLRENPEVLVDAIRALRDKQEMAQRNETQAAVDNFKARLANGLNAPVFGNADASVTMVEFFDYRCGYCKQVFGDVMSIMENDKDVRLVFMEFPILGEDSVVASRAALAVWLNWPERYMDVHDVLMGSRGNLTAEKAMELIASTGIDVAALSEAMQSKEIDQLINENYQLAQSMNINGTPAFIIGDELVPGAISLDDMLQLIDAARNG